MRYYRPAMHPKPDPQDRCLNCGRALREHWTGGRCPDASDPELPISVVRDLLLRLRRRPE